MPKLTSVPTALQAPGYYHDSLHLYLDVQKPGRSASWAFQYEFHGKQVSLGLGSALGGTRAKVSRELARRKAAELNGWLAEGKNPREHLRLKRERGRSFGELAEEKIAQLALNWKNPAKQVREWANSLKQHAARLWGRPASAITDDDVIGVLSPLWHDKRAMAEVLRMRLHAVLEFAMSTKAREYGPNPARLEFVANRLGEQEDTEEHAASMPYQDAPEFLKRVAATEGDDMRVLELAILVGLRSTETTLVEWTEVDLKNRLWTIPWSRMKSTKAEAKKRGNRPHKVVLTDRMVAMFRAMEARRVAGNPYVFPAQRQPESGKPINRAAIEVAMRKLSVPRETASPHGWRATFMEFAKSHFHDGEAVAHWCQGHAPSHGKVGRAYSREQPVALCGELWAAWSDFLTRGKGKVVRLRAVA